jgi:hypothetical protein
MGMTREEKEQTGEYVLKMARLLEDGCWQQKMLLNAVHIIDEVLEQELVLDKIRSEIAEYGSIWVEYKITGRSDKDIEQLVSDVLSQAKKQVLEIIDKYKAESEE